MLSKCDVILSEKYKKYKNEKKCHKFTREIAEHLQEQFVGDLKTSKCISILTDTSFDKSDEVQLKVYVRSIKKLVWCGHHKTFFYVMELLLK